MVARACAGADVEGDCAHNERPNMNNATKILLSIVPFLVATSKLPSLNITARTDAPPRGFSVASEWRSRFYKFHQNRNKNRAEGGRRSGVIWNSFERGRLYMHQPAFRAFPASDEHLSSVAS